MLALVAGSFISVGWLASLSGCRRTPPANEVVLYSSVDEPLLREIMDVYAREHDGRVLLVGDTEATKTTGLLQRLIAERDNPRCDVWWSNEVFSTIGLAQQGMLEPLAIAGELRALGWPAELIGTGDQWIGFAQRARVIVYNTDRVRKDSAPTALADLLKPEFKDRIGIARPQFGTTRGHMAALGRGTRPGAHARVPACAQGQRSPPVRRQLDDREGRRPGRDRCGPDRHGRCLRGPAERLEGGLHARARGRTDANATGGVLPSIGPLVIPNTVARIKNGPESRRRWRRASARPVSMPSSRSCSQKSSNACSPSARPATSPSGRGWIQGSTPSASSVRWRCAWKTWRRGSTRRWRSCLARWERDSIGCGEGGCGTILGVKSLAALIQPEIEEMIRAGQWGDLRDTLHELPPADVAEVFSELDAADAAVAFRFLYRDDAGEVFSYLEPETQEALIAKLGDEGSRRVIEAMSTDDRARLLDELPYTVAQRLIQSLEPEDRKATLAILGYPAESVGRLMTPDYVAVRADWTVEQALAHLRKHGRDAETINVVYITDEQGKLIDDIRIRQLLLADPGATLESIGDSNFVALTADQDQEEAVRLMSRYDRIALPVVDSRGSCWGS
jgi:CBS domain-containing protein